jgi:hypothetical protein
VTYAGWFPSLEGTPWEDWQVNALLEDRDAGCDLLAMAKRARRSFAEVQAKLEELKVSHPPKVRPLQRSRSFGKR